MNKKLLSIIAVCSCLTVHGQSNTYLQTNFDSGIPNDFTLIDNDETPVNASVYQKVDLNGSWSANQIDEKGNYAAFSFSRCNYDLPSDNWMITPGIQLNSENAYLRWEAKSVHYDYRENYKVMISTTGTALDSFKELLSIDQESYHWKTHVVSLASYAHQNVHIAFVCTSKKKFILAIDNLYVGDLSDVAFETTDESKRFSGDTGTAPVHGKIRNTGKPVELKKINCITAEDTYSQVYEKVSLQPDEEVEFNFQIPVVVNEVSGYKLEAEMGDGSIYSLCEDSIICSYYPRTLLAEKATANWCNSCPTAIPVSNRLKDRYHDEAIVLEVHAYDPIECTPYLTGISRWLQGYPSFIYNRMKDYVQNSMNNDEVLKEALLAPTTAKIDMQVERSAEDNSLLTIHTQTEFAKAYDNTSGLYKLGYAIIEKSVQGIVQKNSSSLLQNGEYYFLPYSIPGDIQVYHNVCREGSTAFKGVESSLPEQIETGTNYDFTHSLTIPEEFVQSDNLFAVAFVMNTLTGVVLNATRADIPSPVSGIGERARNDEKRITIFKNSGTSYNIRFADQAPYTIELISLDGRVVDRQTGTAESSVVTVQYPQYKGCYLMKVNQLNFYITQKIMLY